MPPSLYSKSVDVRFPEGKILLAPNGKPSNLTPEQYRLVRTPKFKAWFGDWQNSPETASKVVDKNGEPMVVYHGTNNRFTQFEPTQPNFYSITEGTYFFTDIKEVAENFGDIVLPVFLLIDNPTYLDGMSSGRFNTWTLYDDEGNYGFIVSNSDTGGGIATEYAVENPEQIKLADGTNTTFDGSNPDIRYKQGGSVSNPSLDQKVKQYKELAHAGKTASEILEEIGVDEGVYGEKNKEYTDFYLALAASDLSGKKFPKKARITPVQLEGVEIPLKLKEKNVKITGIGNKDDILQLLKNIVGDDALRPALQGVYFDEKNKSAVATDSMKMVVIPDKSIKKSEIINPIDGNVIDGKYPDWKMVIPDYGKEDAVRVNVQYMLNVLHTVLNSAGYLDISPFVVMLHKGEQFACNAHVMYPVFEVMAKMGFDEATMYLESPRRSFLIKPDSGEVTGLVMPLLLSAFHYTFPGIYTILENGKEVQSFSGRIKTEPTEREIREFMESLTILSDAGDTDAAELLESFKIIYA